MPGLPTHLVQELNVETVQVYRVETYKDAWSNRKHIKVYEVEYIQMHEVKENHTAV